jgi:hypothetical protein
MLSLAKTSQYSGRWNERQKAGKYGEKNLIARALQVEEMGTVTVGTCRERFHPVPLGKSSCREPMQSTLRMLLGHQISTPKHHTPDTGIGLSIDTPFGSLIDKNPNV